MNSQNVLETSKDAFDVAIDEVFRRFKEQENWYNGDEDEDYSINYYLIISLFINKGFLDVLALVKL